MLRVGVHYQTFQQRFIIRLDKYGNKALPYPQPLGVAVCRHDGVIICHGWEIGTLAVQILHDGLSHLGRLQRVPVEVLSLPVGKAFLDHLCHSLIVVLVKGDEQVGFILELIGVIPLRAEEAEGVVVNIGRIVGAVALSVVIACKGTALLIEQHREQTAVQLIPDKLPQIHTGRISFDLFGHFAVFFQEVLAHQVVLHAPAQVDGHVVISIDGVNRQFLLLNALKVIGSVVHLTVKIIIGKGATGDSILTIRLHHKADAVHFAQQGVRVMGQLIFQFIPVERNHLIEVDLLATRQDADLAAIFGILGTSQNGGAQLCVLCKILLIVHGMAEAQPGIAGNGKAGQGFQQADGPVPLFVFHGLLIQLPVRRQGNGQLRPLQLIFRQFLRHIHPVSAHAHGDQGAVVPLLRGRHHADVHMDVGRNQLMEHILELAEILLNVPLDSFHLLLGVDFGITEFFLILRVIIV